MTKQETMLLELGASVSNRGFGYIIKACEVLQERPFLLMNSIHKGLYPAVAEEFHTSEACVERCIRHTVNSIYDHGTPSGAFAPPPGQKRLSNKEFLARFLKEAYSEEG